MDAQGLEPTLRDVLHETLDAERGPHPVWADSPAVRRIAVPQRSRWQLPALWAAAAVLVAVVVGYPFLVGARLGGPGATQPADRLLPSGPAGNGLIALSQDGDIVVADRPGGETRPLVAGPEDDLIPRFTPDGTKLVFLRDGALMLADADGTNVVQLVPGSSDVATSVDWGAWRVAPDSQSLVASAAFDGEKRLLIRPLDPVGATRFLDVRLPASWMYNEPPSFRPTDPTEILVVAQPDPDGPRGIYVYDLATDGSRTIQVEADGQYVRDVAWLPDGDHIVYTLWPEGKTHVVAADGSDDRVADALHGRLSPFSNDGTRIVVQRGGVSESAPQLAVVRVDGEGDPVFLTCGSGSDGCPTQWIWSPDDSMLLGIRDDGEDAPLKETYWQADPDTGQVKQVDWVDLGAPTWQRVAP